METTAAFPGPEVLERRLGEFLQMRGTSRAALRKEADQGFGPPALAVAAGSVLAGFGNVRSDLDLLVLVENEKLNRFPVPSHEHGTTIDVNLRRASTVREGTAALEAEPWPTVDTAGEDAWNHRRRQLITTSRLALGLPIVVSPPWDSWHAGLRHPWLQDAVRRWYALEAHRLAEAARWLSAAKPLVAAVRARGAVVAALNSRAAAGGQVYFAPKWAGEKLKALDDTEGLALLRETLAPGDPPSQVARALDLVPRMTGPLPPLHTVLHWATGAGTMELPDRTLVDRWQLRAVEVHRRGLPAADSGAAIWSGPAGTLPPPELLSLFVHNMVWLSVARPAQEGAIA